MYHKIRALLVLLLALFSLPETVRAANNIITPSLTIGGIYDSNINFSNSTTDVNGIDYIALIRPGLAFSSESKRLTLKSSYSFEAKLYANNPTLNFFTHSGDVEMLDHITPRTSLGLTDTVRFSQETADAFNIGVQTRRTNTFLNTATIDVSHMFTEKTSGDLAYANTLLQFQDPAFSDTRTDTATATASYAYTPTTTLSASYEFTNFTSNTSDGNITTATHTTSLGFSTKPTPSTSLSLSGGAVYTDVLNSHLNWNASAKASKAFKSTSVKLGYSRSITNSIGLSTQIIASQAYSVETAYKIGSSNLLSLSGFLFDDKVIEGTGVDFLSFQGVMTDEYKVNSWLKIVLGYSYFKQEDKAGLALADSFVRNVVYLNFNLTPGGWKL